MEIEQEKKRLKRWQKIFIGIEVFLVALVLLVLTTFAIMRYLGKSRIMSMSAGEIYISELEEDGEEQKKGWVRHNGKLYAYNEDIMTFLVMGIDKEGEVQESEDGMHGGQSDAMFLAVMNPHTKTVSIVAINRNTMVPVDVYDADGAYMGTYTKQICLQHGYGDGREQSCERAVATVSHLFYQLPIHGYVAINMDAIPELNDVVGGVEVTVLEDIIVPEFDVNLRAGEVVTLNGREAYVYTKVRDIYISQSANMRLERQKQYISSFISKAKEQTLSDFSTALNLYDTVSRYMVTDIDLTEFTYLASEAIGYDFDMKNLYTIEGETIESEETDQGEVFEEFYVDEDALYELILEVFYESVDEGT